MTFTVDEEEVLDQINVLPDEILIYIFKCLPLDSLLNCEKVCKRWEELARDPALWRRIVIVYSGKQGQTEVSEKNLEIILSHKEYIQCLKIQYMYIYSVIKFVIDQCENLISLELVMCRIGKDFEYDILKWPNLKKLNLRNSILLSSNIDLMVPFENFCHLQYLALSDFGLSSLNCDSLLGCNYLTHILIEKIKGLGLEFINKLILSKQKIIKTLHIYGGNSINDYTLKLLSNCVSLNDLAIVRCENLTDKGFISLTQLNNLQHLQIWNNNNFTETGILQVLGSPSIKQLKSLSLSRIQNVTPVSVDLLSEYYKNLKFLALYHCPKIIHTDYEKQLKSKFRNIDVVLY